MNAAVRTLKDRKCEHRPCRKVFTPERPGQKACSAQCALAAFRAKQEAARERKAKRERRAVRVAKREGLIKLRSVSDWTKLAQLEFNKFIRLRDDGLPCISCGILSPPEFHGGAWDCGHFLSVGAHPELRFEERNAARQCKACNSGTRRGGAYVMPLERQQTIHAAYREGLLARSGPEVIEWLEGPHEAKRYRIDDLIAIRDTYRTKARELKRLNDMGHREHVA